MPRAGPVAYWIALVSSLGMACATNLRRRLYIQEKGSYEQPGMARQDHLREWAVHMLAIAAKTDDRQFAEWLAIRARQYLCEARALERTEPSIVGLDCSKENNNF
jgi:hypothetical protein